MLLFHSNFSFAPFIRVSNFRPEDIYYIYRLSSTTSVYCRVRNLTQCSFYFLNDLSLIDYIDIIISKSQVRDQLMASLHEKLNVPHPVSVCVNLC